MVEELRGHSCDFGGQFDRLPSPIRFAGCWSPITGEHQVDEYVSQIADALTALVSDEA